MLSFVIAGNTTDVEATLSSLCDTVHEHTTYQFDGTNFSLSAFLNVDDEAYYGVTCYKDVSSIWNLIAIVKVQHCGPLSVFDKQNTFPFDYSRELLVGEYSIKLYQLFKISMRKYSINALRV